MPCFPSAAPDFRHNERLDRSARSRPGGALPLTGTFVASAILLTFAACGGTDGFSPPAISPDRGDGGADVATPLDGGPLHDAWVEQDGAVEAAPDASPDTGMAPRLVSPLSTSRVTSRRPTLHWLLPAGVTDVTVDLCLDRACARPIGTSAHATGSSYAPPNDLPTGIVFWRLHPSTDVNVTSATWEFSVGARTAAVDTSWGTTLDVNGDGFADVAVGAPQIDVSAGAASVFLGGAAGLSTIAATTVTGPEGMLGKFGATVTSAGDLNGDGFAELAVATSGIVYVYDGSSAGLVTTPLTIPCPAGTGVSKGVSVASAGDVNGDGYGDLVVGGGPSGGVFLYLGGASGLATTPSTTIAGVADVDASIPNTYLHVASAGDVNGDGFGDVVVDAFEGSWGTEGGVFIFLGGARGLATTPATVLPGAIDTAPNEWEFNPSVANAGDVNGDGYADVVVATCGAQDSACVYLGSAGGIVSTAATVLVVANSDTGIGVGAGDVNGDGYDDVALSVSNLMDGSHPVSVYLGGAGGLSMQPAVTLTEPNAAVDGFGEAIASAGDVNGDGFADVVVGASRGTPSTAQDDTGSAYIFLGRAMGPGANLSTAVVGVEGANGQFGSAVY